MRHVDRLGAGLSGEGRGRPAPHARRAGQPRTRA